MARDHLSARCRDVVKTYRTESSEVRALKGVSADFAASAVTAVVGASGSGKSSLLRIIAGLDRPNSGLVHVEAIETTALGARARRRLLRNLVGYVFQSPAENFVSYLTVLEHLRLAGRRVGATEKRARGVLERLKIDHRASHLPRELSGGEQQRAAFAQVIMTGASLVVADEPTAELDGQSSERVLAAMRELAGEGIGFIVATHDAQVAEIAHSTIEIEHGEVTRGGGA